MKPKKPGRPLDPNHEEKDQEYRQYPKGPNGESLYFNQVPAGPGGEALEADAVGFMARFLVLATLPHSNPGEATRFGRKNGSFSYHIESGSYLDEQQQTRFIGLPYGSIPRLLLCWLTTEAVRTKEREIELGERLSHFMEKLEIQPTGGKWGSILRLREQMKRFFSSKVSYTYEEKNGFFSGNVQLASEAKTFWKEDERFLPSEIPEPDQLLFLPLPASLTSYYRARVLLGKEFFHEVTTRPVPIDLRVVHQLRKSPLSLDMYYWFTHRVSYLQQPTTIAWKALHAQFGSDFGRLVDFKKKFIKHFASVQECYPQLRVLIDREYGVTLYMSRTSVKMAFSAAAKHQFASLPATLERADEPKQLLVGADHVGVANEDIVVPF